MPTAVWLVILFTHILFHSLSGVPFYPRYRTANGIIQEQTFFTSLQSGSCTVFPCKLCSVYSDFPGVEFCVHFSSPNPITLDEYPEFPSWANIRSISYDPRISRCENDIPLNEVLMIIDYANTKYIKVNGMLNQQSGVYQCSKMGTVEFVYQVNGVTTTIQTGKTEYCGPQDSLVWRNKLVCNPCPLSLYRHSLIKGIDNQADFSRVEIVVHNEFVEKMDTIMNCAANHSLTLTATSSARTMIPPSSDVPYGKSKNSNHLAGFALDFNAKFVHQNKTISCDSKCLFHYRDDELPIPVRDFIDCVKDRDTMIRYGGDFTSLYDPVHFDVEVNANEREHLSTLNVVRNAAKKICGGDFSQCPSFEGLSQHNFFTSFCNGTQIANIKTGSTTKSSEWNAIHASTYNATELVSKLLEVLQTNGTIDILEYNDTFIKTEMDTSVIELIQYQLRNNNDSIFMQLGIVEFEFENHTVIPLTSFMPHSSPSTPVITSSATRQYGLLFILVLLAITHVMNKNVCVTYSSRL